MPRMRKLPPPPAGTTNGQTTLQLGPPREEHLDIASLETWLWDAACIIRGATDAPKFKDFILPLVFYKRLSDVYDDEAEALAEQFGDRAMAREVIAEDHADALRSGRPPIVRFFVPEQYSWWTIRNHGADGKLGEFVTEAMRKVAELNPDLQGVLDVKDFNERQAGERALDDERLEQELRAVQGPALLLCDCNLTDTSQAYAQLATFLSDSFREVGWGLGHSSFGRRAPYLGQRLDYVWHTDGLVALEAVVGPDGGSDHRPVVARLALRR